MNRRDFTRLAVGAGLGSVTSKPTLAQMSTEEVQSPGATPTSQSVAIKNSPRTYNQVTIPRKYTAGKQRVSVYWTWSYPWESNRDLSQMDNRFSTMTEVRRTAWPFYEKPERSERMFLQGIAGTLELFHLSIVRFKMSLLKLPGTR